MVARPAALAEMLAYLQDAAGAMHMGGVRAPRPSIRSNQEWCLHKCADEGSQDGARSRRL
jgi:hypothetical protein